MSIQPYKLDECYARGTGRTTRIAINLVDAMLKEPGKQFEIIDHYGHIDADSRLAVIVCDVLAVLGIKATITEVNYDRRIFISIKPINRI